MLLESLLGLVEKLGGRIETHGSPLRQSEALTRSALIDPLLRELGWDTEDPDVVVPEYRSEAGSADYALFSGNNQPPVVIVEAKRLGERLDGRVALQGVNYCNLVGTPYFALTDGRTWKIYATFERAPLEDRLITEFAIGGMNAADVSIKALALWRHNVASGSISPAQAPITGGVSEASADVAQPPEPVSVAAPAPTTPALSGEWRPLSEAVGIDKTLKLQGIMFPDGSSVTTRNWNELTVEVVRWLNDNNHLPTPPFRIQTRKSETRYVVAEQSISPSGEHYDGMTEVAAGVWVINHLHHDTAAGNARFAIEHESVRMDSSKFKVRY